jgi:hypothetical protein
MRLPGRNAPSSVEDTAAHLRAGMGSARRGRQSLAELRNREREILEAWFHGFDRVFPEDPTLSLDQRQAHGEHCVAFHPDTLSWWKTTHPGKCGVGAEFHYDDLPPFAITSVSARELLPSEYLERLTLHNREFGDDIRVEGYVHGPLPSLVISQPGVEGKPATADEMEQTMRNLGYLPIPSLHVGRSASISFYHPSKRIALFDAHPANFFCWKGIALPVDGIILHIRNDSEHQWLSDRISGASHL